MRNERVTLGEYELIVQSFSGDSRMQCFITVATDSLASPQEILSRKLKHIEWFDSHAVINLTENGKEGTKLIQVMESFPYLVQWFDKHPQKNNPEAYLFVNVGTCNNGKQWRPRTVNKLLKNACEKLKLDVFRTLSFLLIPHGEH